MKRSSKTLKKKKYKLKTAPWSITYTGFSPKKEGLHEAICTLGNGYMGTRGALEGVKASEVSYPGTYIAGVYNTLGTSMAGRVINNEDLVNCPNWLEVSFRPDGGEWTTPLNSKILSFKQELDLRQGVLAKEIRLKDADGRRTKIETKRLVSMADPHRAALSFSIVPENYSSSVTIRSGLDGTVENTGVARYRTLKSLHLKPVSCGRLGPRGVFLTVKTSQSKILISEASKIRTFSAGREKAVKIKVLKEEKAVYQEFTINVKKGVTYSIEKDVSVFTSNDCNISNPEKSAKDVLKRPARFSERVKSHAVAWSLLWNKFDIEIKPDEFSQSILRLHLFHLLQTASPYNDDIDAGLPARGLHGEAYRGHIFWDELFVMPLYDRNEPDITRSLLEYRYRRLKEARQYARQNNYKGAMFPWQSGSSGKEETQVVHLNPMSGKWGPDYSCNQRHNTFAIAHNVWQYWEVSGDRCFMEDAGAEILLSIAQFGASIAKKSKKDDRYHTEGLMGPDEFHEKYPGSKKAGLRDNSYTNLLIVWTLIKAGETLEILSDKRRNSLMKKLGITSGELGRWEDISKKMKIVISRDGIISQFDGYFKLKELDWEAYRVKYGNIHRLDRILKSEGKSPDKYKLSKQGDLLMLFYLLPLYQIEELFIRLGYKINKDMLGKNYDYYVVRTSHGSTLSKVVHCYVAQLLGWHKESWRWFVEILRSDIQDTQGGTTPEGIHTGVMGGSIDIVLRGFSGIDLSSGIIKIVPRLPAKWKSIRQKFIYQGTHIDIAITKSVIKLTARNQFPSQGPLPVEICGEEHLLTSGKKYEFEY